MRRKNLKLKTVFSSLLTTLLILTTLPAATSAQTHNITFSDARVVQPDHSVHYVSIWIKVSVIETGVPVYEGNTPVVLSLEESIWYEVQIHCNIEKEGKQYRFWSWNIIGAVDLELMCSGITNDVPVLVWKLHTTGGDSSLEPVYMQAGPQIDQVRFLVIKSPGDKRTAMDDCLVDVWSCINSFPHTQALILESPSGITKNDIEELDVDGFTVTCALAFHVKFMGLNIRPDQSYRRPEITFWPLADVNFRHALVHCYDQEEIVGEIEVYTAIPTRSLVPPAQGEWYNSEVSEHPYNPGNPFTYLPEHSTCGILRAAGYEFVDADLSLTVTDSDYWLTPSVEKLPSLFVYTPTYEECPKQAEHGARFVEDCRKIALAGTEENEESGLIHKPMDSQAYLKLVYQNADFDIYMAGLNLGRFPDHLYPMCHSSQDSQQHSGKFNAPGTQDPLLDLKLETLKFSLVHDMKLEACHEIQSDLYNETHVHSAFAYIPMYARIYFNAFKPGLKGIVDSHGYGSDNKWTFLNIRWEPGHLNERIEEGNSTVIWILGGEPEPLNPLCNYTASAWEIMARTMDNLIAVNPYTHEDMPWIAESWETVETPTGPGAMNITFHLRKDIVWQDGSPYTAEDAEFNWLFLRDNEIPRYESMWEHIIDVTVVNDYEVRVCLSETSQFLIYDLACTAAMLPEPVWSRFNGKPLVVILAYDPSKNTTKPEGAGPWFGTTGCITQLYGTGPFVFEFYDLTIMYGEVSRFEHYFRVTDDIHDQKVEIFHKIGDVDYDGYIDIYDLSGCAFAYGKRCGKPGYNPDADLNEDCIIDAKDLALICYNYGKQREYPVP